MPGGIHKWIVEALGDSEALTQLRPDDRLAPDDWRAAVERVRQSRFAELPAWEGAVAVGAFMARRFLASDAGRITREAISAMTVQRALSTVIGPMSDRMRSEVEFDFTPGPEGGVFEVRGQIEVSAGTLMGFFGALIESVPGRHELKLAHQAPRLIRFELVISA